MSEEKAVATFVGGKSRAKTVALDWPVEFGGKEYREVHVSRLTVKEVADFIDGLDDDAGVTMARLPMFRDAAGDLIPDAVLSALDDDDKFALDEAARDFLPRRFRAAPEETSPPAAGAPIGPSSSA